MTNDPYSSLLVESRYPLTQESIAVIEAIRKTNDVVWSVVMPRHLLRQKSNKPITSMPMGK
jgi:hypothetical protein